MVIVGESLRTIRNDFDDTLRTLCPLPATGEAPAPGRVMANLLFASDVTIVSTSLPGELFHKFMC